MNIEQIIGEWERDKKWIDNFTRDFPTLANVADGIANGQTRNAPVVGTVAVASSVRQIPRASIQQVPSLSVEVNGTKQSVNAIVDNFLLRRVVFNEDTFGKGILSTMQMAAQSALTYGFQALRADVGKLFNQFGTTLEALHYNDVAIEAGVMDDSASGRYQVRTRVTSSALKRLIAAAKKNKKTLWSVPALEELLASGPQPMDYSNFGSEARRNPALGEANQFDIITRYGVGPYYSIDVYSPQLEKSLMSTKSKSKFGYPRISFIVIDPDSVSPFGISRVRLATPMANYGNYYLQSTAKMLLLNADPPTLERGLFTTATPLKRGARWKTIDPNADVNLKELSNSTLQQFEQVMRYVENQIYAIMGVSSTGSAQSSSAYQNSASVQAQSQARDMSSAQVTAIVENAIRQYALTALDLFLSEQVGQTSLIVDDEAKQALNQLMGEGFCGDDNIVNIDWAKHYDEIKTWTVTVDLSVSKQQLESKERADMQDYLTVEKQTANPNDPKAQARIDAISDSLLKKMAPEVAQSSQVRQSEAAPQPQLAVGNGMETGVQANGNG
jgi:hypothetical protein